MAHIHTNRLKAVHHFEQQVVVPGIFKYETGNGYRLVYKMENGSGWKEVILQNNDGDTASILKQANLISTYIITHDGEVKMFRSSELGLDGQDNVFWIKPREVSLDDIEITPGIVTTLAAINELNKVESKYGIVRNLFTQNNRAA